MTIEFSRRQAIVVTACGVTALPAAAHGEQSEPMRRVAVLMAYREGDQEGRIMLDAFTTALADFGWKTDRNVLIEYRWAGSDNNRMRGLAKELVACSQT